MLIFLDESGTTSFKFGAGASRYFVVIMVIFDAPADAERVSAAVSALRQKLHLPSDYEFRFSTGSSERVKNEFLQMLLPYNFRYRAIVVDKRQFWQRHRQQAGERLFDYVVAQLLQSAGGIQNATVFVDQIAVGEFARRFNVYVRQQLRASGAQPIRKFKHVDSRRNNLIQVADMVCGAVYRAYARGDDTYWRVIRAKEEIVVELK